MDGEGGIPTLTPGFGGGGGAGDGASPARRRHHGGDDEDHLNQSEGTSPAVVECERFPTAATRSLSTSPNRRTSPQKKPSPINGPPRAPRAVPEMMAAFDSVGNKKHHQQHVGQSAAFAAVTVIERWGSAAGALIGRHGITECA